MVKTYLKTFSRTFRRHLTRLLSIALMVLISIGFSAGIGMATDKLNYALDDLYREKNMSDLIVKSTRDEGFTEEELALLKERYGEKNLMYGSSLEFKDREIPASTTEMDTPIGTLQVTTEITFENVSEGVSKVYFFDMPPSELAQNTLTVTETAQRPTDLATDVIDIYVEAETAQLLAHAPGERLTATVKSSASTPFGEQSNETTYEFFVRGTVENPLHTATRHDVSLQFTDEKDEQLKLENIFYIFNATNQGIEFGTNDVYIALDRTEKPVTSSYYEKRVREEAEAIEALLSNEAATTDMVPAEALTLYENFSLVSFHEFAVKIQGIGIVMVIVFLLVTLLVVLSTMLRFLDEERAQLACLMTLGYSPFKITLKYLIFALVSTLIGAVGGFFAGLGLAYIVYINFEWVYAIPPFPSRISTTFYFIVSAGILIAALAATLIAGLRKTRKRPAVLLRPKAPRPGKKVILEKIPVLWNRFSFKYKSSLRNVLRYMARFLMTVVAVMAATALVFAGLAVLECCLLQDMGTSAMIAVALVVLIFAALLNAVVIYTLTNINISERERELATLMVLGYYDNEVSGYVFREVYITSAIGILLGIPFGAVLCAFIFKLMELGSLSTIGWYIWVAAPLVSLLFTFLVALLLTPKIVRIKMNDSLKSIE